WTGPDERRPAELRFARPAVARALNERRSLLRTDECLAPCVSWRTVGRPPGERPPGVDRAAGGRSDPPALHKSRVDLQGVLIASCDCVPILFRAGCRLPTGSG